MERAIDDIVQRYDIAIRDGDADALDRGADELHQIGTPLALALESLWLGMAAFARSDFENALAIQLRSYAMNDELQNKSGMSMALRGIGLVHMERNDSDAAIKAFEESLAIGIELSDKRSMAKSLNNIGIVYHRIGSYAAALTKYFEAFAINEEMNDDDGMSNNLINVGVVYEVTADYPKAIEYYLKALSIRERVGGNYAFAQVYNNTGNLYLRLGDYKEAIRYLNQASELYISNRNVVGLANATNSIGLAYADMEQYERSIEYFERSYSMYAEKDNVRGQQHATVNIMSVQVTRNDFDAARATMNSLTVESLFDTVIKVTYLMACAAIADHDDDLVTAFEHLNAALAIASEYGLLNSEKDVHFRMRDMYLKKNDLQGYVFHNDRYIKIMEDTRGSDASRRVALAEKEREFDLQRKEHEKHMAVLHNTLPKHIADRVARGETVNDHYEHAAVMFLDIVGFTSLSSKLTSQQVTTLLDAVFEICDEACKQYNVTRIKTIGDSYLAVGGLEEQKTRGLEEQKTRGLEEQKTRVVAEQIASAALEIIEQIQIADFASLLVASSRFQSLQVRIGLHCGPVTAGVLGKERLQYDVWGDTVNVASRMESTGEPNKIHVSEQFAQALSPLSEKERGLGESSRGTEKERGLGESSRATEKERGLGESSRATEKERGLGESSLLLAFRGETEVKGKGMMHTYWLERTK